MEKALLLFLCLVFTSFAGAQTYRTIDGTNNNLNEPEWGARDGHIRRITDIGYADGVEEPGGLTRPNPRHISNMLFVQEKSINGPIGMSDYTWAFGQFIDHDITLTAENHNDPLNIPVPPGDPMFDPFGSGNAYIPMVRNVFDEGTSTGPDNPRQFRNDITAWLDGSAVYGSDEERAAWLRTFQGGKLKVSAGNLLPFNTLDGEYTGTLDENAPFMANMNRATTRFFVAGDDRANENVLLASIHTLFVREHNRQAELIAVRHSDWNDEQIYQHARKIVGGMIQALVYNEWLPTMGIILPDYNGYQDDVNPDITNAFAVAAYRMGHTLINTTIVRIDENGETIPEGNLSLSEAFFEPTEILLGHGLDPLLKGMATQPIQKFDCHLVEDLRSFLFGKPGQGGLDLASINIMRGRERGLPDYNTIRKNLGLTPKQTFLDICPDPHEAEILEMLYGTVYNIDPWVGMLAEDHMPNAMLGETAMEVIKRQFLALRNGDRFYFEIDEDLSDAEKAMIRNMTMANLVRTNSGVVLMQDDAFMATPHALLTPTNDVFVQTEQLQAYPNPTNGQVELLIESVKQQNAMLRLYDINGRMLQQQSLHLQTGTNNIAYYLAQETGVYTLVVQLQDRQLQQRVVKL